MKITHVVLHLGVWTLLTAAQMALVVAQDAAPADRNAVNTAARPGGMMADSPVTFPKQGALPSRYPPDVKERSEPAEKDYYIFSSPCRSLAQIATIQREMPKGGFTPPPADWTHLRRTRRILTEGGDLRLLAVGDSIVNDTMRSGWVAQLQEAYPKARIQATVYVRGGGGCQHYREEGRVEKYIQPRQPNLVFIGGISQKNVESIREVIRQLRAGLPEVEILLATGTFGTADPRDADALARAPHSGTGAYGQGLKALAAEERCAYLDMTAPWAEYIRSSKLHPHLFYRDVVHANEYGEQILGKILMAFWAPAQEVRTGRPGAAIDDLHRTLPQRSLSPPVRLPDGGEFTTWEPVEMRFSRTYHVNASHSRASDSNPGTEARPFATVSRAAQVLQPGERVVVGPGIYRERIRPAHGGSDPTKMISYEAEPGTQVILRGSRVFSGNWTRGQGSQSNLWSARLDDGFFDGYQPFALPNVTEKQFESMDWAQPQRGKVPFTLVRGLVFQDGQRLAQVAGLNALATHIGAYWMDRTNRTLHARFFGDVDPTRALVELTTQDTVFAPEQPGLGFIRVKGFVVEHAAGPFPWEQVGAISATRGHHWIIEDCTVRQVNGVGLDLGIQHPRWPQPPQIGFHIVRRNVVTDCGICGICGLGSGRGREFGLLIEDNVVMRNAWHDAELLWETGGIKTHCNVRCLIRRNLVAETRHGSGIWMDWDNRASRCCQNIIIGSRTRNGAIFVEASTVPNLVDQNIVWDTAGHGIYEHDSRRQIFAHNLVGQSSGESFHLHGKITDRRVGSEPMTYGAHYVANNLSIGHAKADTFRGEPSIMTNHVSLAGGIRLNPESLELRVEEALALEREPAFVAPVRHDFFGVERSRTSTAVGPFAATPAKGSRISMWRGQVPNPPAFPLKVSENHRHLVDQQGRPFFVLGDTPWFIQKLKIEDVRMLMEDRVAKGFNTLFLEVLDDSRILSRDGYGNVAFNPEKDITKPVEAYWQYAEQVMEEAERRGLFVIHSELWYGAGGGLWMHHVKPDNAKVYGAFIGKRFARFKNLMWMHAGDRNPDPNLAECTRVLAREIAAAAPRHLHTVHNAHEFASARFHHEDAWLDVNLGYTYGAAYLHILPEYQRADPVRPVILGETGYEDEPNAIELLPDATRGDLWTPYRIRRNAWWAVLSGASGYCAGTRLWRWEKNWREVLHARSIREAPHILRCLERIAWWKLVPDTKHEFVTTGFGEWKKADYATAALAEDGSCGVVYLPSPRTITVNLSKLNGPVTARWFDPAGGKPQAIEGTPFANTGTRTFTPPGKNTAGEPDWVLMLGGR